MKRVKKMKEKKLGREEQVLRLRTWILDRLDVVSSLDLKGVDLERFVMVRCREGIHL